MLLTADQQQCLRYAGLFENSEQAIFWWDSLASQFCMSEAEAKNRNGREVERLSMAHEERRLRELGIDDEPECVGVDDNLCGYDIKSYNRL